ncbi:MAG: hypothetical protein H7269_11085 [Cellulomonas sp.]|nr:hypothetical protein [Cellulomonas sp.]
MEHKGQGRLEDSWTAFEELLTGFPDYVASYLQAGGVLTALGRRDEGADVYRRGIDVATRTGDSHARGELETALAELDAS